VISHICVSNTSLPLPDPRRRSPPKELLIEEWRRFKQNIIDRAVNQWRDRLGKWIRAEGGHFEYLM